MSDDFFDDLENEAAEAPKPKADLNQVKAMGDEVAKLQKAKIAAEEVLKDVNVRLYKLTREEMPAVMDEMKVPYIGVDGFNLEVTTYYKANIATDDPEEKREAAFAWVEEAGGADIINNAVIVMFPKEEYERAAEYAREVRNKFHNQQNIKVTQEKKVPWNRLTSWLKDYVTTPPKKGETKLAVPLELLNATIGRIVKINPIKED